MKTREEIEKDRKEFHLYLSSIICWMIIAVIVGVVIGPCGAVFGLLLNKITAYRQANDWLLYLLPFCGLVIVFLYRYAGLPNGGSTNAVFTAVRDDEVMPLRAAPLIFVATLLTHLGGGSSGREGAALQLGGAMAGKIGKILHLDDTDCRVITICGMAAAFSAIFGTPLGAAVFSVEVISVGTMYYVALVPAVLSALIGVWISGKMGLAPEAFVLESNAELSPVSMLQVLVLAALVAVLSIIVCEVLHKAPVLYAKYFPNPYVRVFAAGCIVLLLNKILGVTDYNGAGGQIIEAAIEGSALPYAFILKILLTALTLGGGFKGGEIVPVFFTGATFGCVIAPLFGMDASLGAALAMVGLFCGVSNCPIASTFLACEMFGGKCLPLFALMCAATYMMSGYYGLYSEQKIMYSKLRAEFINKKLGH